MNVIFIGCTIEILYIIEDVSVRLSECPRCALKSTQTSGTKVYLQVVMFLKLYCYIQDSDIYYGPLIKDNLKFVE